MKPLHLNVAAKASLAGEAAYYINRLASANGFTTAINEDELCRTSSRIISTGKRYGIASCITTTSRQTVIISAICSLFIQAINTLMASVSGLVKT